jgi:two-component system, NtrC family, sensor kinase
VNPTTNLTPDRVTRDLGSADGLPGYAHLFKSIFECSAIGMAVLTVNGQCVSFNRAFCDLIGYTAEKIPADTLPEITHPDDRALSLQTLRQLISGEVKSCQIETRLVHKSGRPVWVLLTATPIPRGDQQQPDLAVAMIQDISQRKAAEEALQRSEARPSDDRLHAQETLRDREERLRLLLDSTAEAIYGLDPGGNCTFCNQALLQALGYPDASALLGRNMHELIHHSRADGSVYPLDECWVFRTLRGGIGTHVDDEVVWRSDGTCLPVEYWSHPVKREGTIVGCTVTFVDITARKAAQEALRRAHEEAELFINSVPSILIGVSRDSRIKRWNLAAAKVFVLAKGEVAGKPLADCGIQWVRSDMRAEISSWCAGLQSRRVEALPFVINGETRFLGLTLNWISAPEENIDELLIIGSDVTEREILGQQLRQAQKLEAIGQLAAGIAHEINTPTQYVSDNTRFLQESWPSFAELLAVARDMRQEASQGPVSCQTLKRIDALAQAADFEYLRIEIPRAIEQSLEGIQRVGNIVRAMKDFSHPGSEEKRSVDINKAIETTITVARNEWKYVADVETQFDLALPVVLCHAGEFNQVILNLLINAAQAIAQTAEDGSQGKGKIVISTARDQDWVEISISDTGVGIPEAVRSRVFEPFFTTKPAGKGTGQGLALAPTAIVRRHGGKIWFDSELGKGTTFYIRMPLTQPSEA